MMPAGFGCPCHGGQYDTEGNRTAGPPVRASTATTSRSRTDIILLEHVLGLEGEGTGKQAKIHKYKLAGPGEHVDGIEQILYPLNRRTTDGVAPAAHEAERRKQLQQAINFPLDWLEERSGSSAGSSTSSSARSRRDPTGCRRSAPRR